MHHASCRLLANCLNEVVQTANPWDEKDTLCLPLILHRCLHADSVSVAAVLYVVHWWHIVPGGIL